MKYYDLTLFRGDFHSYCFNQYCSGDRAAFLNRENGKFYCQNCADSLNNKANGFFRRLFNNRVSVCNLVIGILPRYYNSREVKVTRLYARTDRDYRSVDHHYIFHPFSFNALASCLFLSGVDPAVPAEVPVADVSTVVSKKEKPRKTEEDEDQNSVNSTYVPDSTTPVVLAYALAEQSAAESKSSSSSDSDYRDTGTSCEPTHSHSSSHHSSSYDSGSSWSSSDSSSSSFSSSYDSGSSYSSSDSSSSYSSDSSSW